MGDANVDAKRIRVNGLPLDTPSAGRSAAAAALQAEAALANLKILLAEGGSSVGDICKITVSVVDRSFRVAVYPVIGRHLRGVHPVSTGLVIGSLSQPDILFELDVCVVPGHGVPHRRFRKYHSSVARYGFAGQNLDCEFCMAVRAGPHVFLRGQTGTDLDEKLQGEGDAGLQAEQAMKNVQVLLDEAGAKLKDVTRAVLYVTDHAYQAPALAAVMREFGGIAPAISVMIVDGLASPELLMEIDIYAMVSEVAIQ
jgi:enamine deaminase RidA (YjgF/YER057c/UK114 family)